MTSLRAAALAASTLLFTAGVQAQEGPSWRLSGYGTLGAVITDSSEVQYHSSLRQSHGAINKPDWGVDSRLGAQADVRLNSTFSGAAQLLAARRDGSEGPRIEWLYGQAALGETVALRAGRLVLPVFLLSDARNVGYAQHWLRTPAEVYMIYPPSSFDGAQLQWRPQWHDVNFTVQASAGAARSRMYTLGMDIDLKFNSLRSLNVVAESGNWTYRAGITAARSRLAEPSLGPLLYVMDNFSSVGLQYDDGTWLLLSEYAKRRQSQNGAFDSVSYYVSGGRRFGAWMPYVTYAQLDPKGYTGVGQPIGRTTSGGVRWDVRTNVALKAQYETSIPSSQTFLPGNAFSNMDRIRTLSLAADFVF